MSKHKDVEEVTKQSKQKNIKLFNIWTPKKLQIHKNCFLFESKTSYQHLHNEKNRKFFSFRPVIRFATSRLISCIKLINQEVSTNSTFLLMQHAWNRRARRTILLESKTPDFFFTFLKSTLLFMKKNSNLYLYQKHSALIRY